MRDRTCLTLYSRCNHEIYVFNCFLYTFDALNTQLWVRANKKSHTVVYASKFNGLSHKPKICIDLKKYNTTISSRVCRGNSGHFYIFLPILKYQKIHFFCFKMTQILYI